MPRHAVVTLQASPARSEAIPHRRDRHPVRSGDGRRPGDERRPGGRGESPATPPRRLQHILDGLRVLVVDDDPDVLDLFATALTTCGADATSADNARDALALAMQARPHVVVSDIAMVGEDGYWLVRELRGLAPTIPVIAATAYGREHPRARVLAAGFTEHLQKPIDPEALCRLVAKVAGR